MKKILLVSLLLFSTNGYGLMYEDACSPVGEKPRELLQLVRLMMAADSSANFIENSPNTLLITGSNFPGSSGMSYSILFKEKKGKAILYRLKLGDDVFLHPNEVIKSFIKSVCKHSHRLDL